MGEIDTPYVFAANVLPVKGQDWTERMLLYYFLFYDLEGAVNCANARAPFWEYVEGQYAVAKRGKARRHFRGQAGAEACNQLGKIGAPKEVWNALYCPSYDKLATHIKANFQGCQIGDYFTWKLMDIFDRCLGMPVSLSLDETIKWMPDTPRKGVRQMWKADAISDVLNRVVGAISDIDAPGLPTRKCNFAEAETILCAMYGYNKGTYKVGDDIRSRHEQLAPWPDLVVLLPPQQDWSLYERGPLDASLIPA